jgi:hypothetical protein
MDSKLEALHIKTLEVAFWDQQPAWATGMRAAHERWLKARGGVEFFLWLQGWRPRLQGWGRPLYFVPQSGDGNA